MSWDYPLPPRFDWRGRQCRNEPPFRNKWGKEPSEIRKKPGRRFLNSNLKTKQRIINQKSDINRTSELFEDFRTDLCTYITYYQWLGTKGIGQKKTRWEHPGNQSKTKPVWKLKRPYDMVSYHKTSLELRPWPCPSEPEIAQRWPVAELDAPRHGCWKPSTASMESTEMHPPLSTTKCQIQIDTKSEKTYKNMTCQGFNDLTSNFDKYRYTIGYSVLLIVVQPIPWMFSQDATVTVTLSLVLQSDWQLCWLARIFHGKF